MLCVSTQGHTLEGSIWYQAGVLLGNDISRQVSLQSNPNLPSLGQFSLSSSGYLVGEKAPGPLVTPKQFGSKYKLDVGDRKWHSSLKLIHAGGQRIESHPGVKATPPRKHTEKAHISFSLSLPNLPQEIPHPGIWELKQGHQEYGLLSSHDVGGSEVTPPWCTGSSCCRLLPRKVSSPKPALSSIITVFPDPVCDL